MMRGKLVRDKIPQIIRKNEGKKPHIRVLSKKEFQKELRKKLLEEASEAARAKNKRELALEIADVEEVLAALRSSNAPPEAHIQALQIKKRKERGGFTKRIFLIG